MGLRPLLAGTLERRLDAESAGADARPSAPALPPAPERAAELMGFYADADVRAVFDVSGGNLSNELLDRIDYAFLAAHPKPLFGYSDLTALLNAVHARAARPAVLYRPSTWSAGRRAPAGPVPETLARRERAVFAARILSAGERMSGPAVGGNLRCFLKLAGTGYMPDLCGKILALESLHGTPAQVLSGFCQLGQLGVRGRVRRPARHVHRARARPGARVRTAVPRAGRARASDRVLPVAATDRLGTAPTRSRLVLGREYTLEQA